MNLSIIQRSHDTPYSKWEVEPLAPFSISFTRTECSAGRLEAIETSRIKIAIIKRPISVKRVPKPMVITCGSAKLSFFSLN